MCHRSVSGGENPANWGTEASTHLCDLEMDSLTNGLLNVCLHVVDLCYTWSRNLRHSADKIWWRVGSLAIQACCLAHLEKIPGGSPLRSTRQNTGAVPICQNGRTGDELGHSISLCGMRDEDVGFVWDGGVRERCVHG